MKINRRDFIAKSTLASSSLLIPTNVLAENLLFKNTTTSKKLELFLFSKCLQFLNYEDSCKAAKEIGLDGLDLTVRPKGHVLPENVKEHLPKVTDLMKLYGLTPKMISTSVISAKNPTNITLLKTAKKLGYNIYRTGWIKYNNKYSIQENLLQAKNEFTQLAKLNKSIGITGGYQNHNGLYIGSPIWDIAQIFQGYSPSNLGSQYDIMHATVEGGKNWELGFKLIKPHINSIVLKDFKWEKVNNKWKVVYVPLGEGMIDFYKYFKLLKEHNINVPISLHVEYDLGGAELGKTSTMPTNKIVGKLKKDVDFVKKVWNEVNN